MYTYSQKTYLHVHACIWGQAIVYEIGILLLYMYTLKNIFHSSSRMWVFIQ